MIEDLRQWTNNILSELITDNDPEWTIAEKLIELGTILRDGEAHIKERNINFWKDKKCKIKKVKKMSGAVYYVKVIIPKYKKIDYNAN